MPLYEVKCHKCGKQEDIFRKVADFDNLPFCCDEKMARVISASFVHAEFPAYKSMLTGEMVTDRGRHRRLLKEHGCTEVGNESMEPKRDLFKEKKQAYELRKDIAQRLG